MLRAVGSGLGGRRVWTLDAGRASEKTRGDGRFSLCPSSVWAPGRGQGGCAQGSTMRRTRMGGVLGSGGRPRRRATVYAALGCYPDPRVDGRGFFLALPGFSWSLQLTPSLSLSLAVGPGTRGGYWVHSKKRNQTVKSFWPYECGAADTGGGESQPALQYSLVLRVWQRSMTHWE